MDAYSGYNHIKMNLLDVPKATFMTNNWNYYYNLIPYDIKNAAASY